MMDFHEEVVEVLRRDDPLCSSGGTCDVCGDAVEGSDFHYVRELVRTRDGLVGRTDLKVWHFACNRWTERGTE